MLRIRLQRSGRKGRANYRIVVAEHSAPIQGRAVSLLGTYDPLVDKHGLNIDEESVRTWIGKGAKPTNTVARLLKGKGITGMEAFIKDMKDKKIKNPKEQPEPTAPAAQTPAAAEEISKEEPVQVEEPPVEEKVPEAA